MSIGNSWKNLSLMLIKICEYFYFVLRARYVWFGTT